MVKLPTKIKRISDNINDVIKYGVEERITSEIDNIKDLILNGFDGLSSRVNNPNSKTDPALFRKQFENELEEFEFLGESSNGDIRIILPDIENFSFSGMKIIERILEGTAGLYVEISHEDYEKITGKTTVNEDPVDPTVPKQKRVYVIKYTSKIKKQEREVLSKALIKFPFSNTPPLEDEVFGVADEYVDNNLDIWIDEAIEKSSKLISTKYKGV